MLLPKIDDAYTECRPTAVMRIPESSRCDRCHALAATLDVAARIARGYDFNVLRSRRLLAPSLAGEEVRGLSRRNSDLGTGADVYINDVRKGEIDQDAPLFTDASGNALTGNAVRKLFDRLKVATGIDDLCAHMLRHTWATNYHRSASGSRFDLQTDGGWRTGRMVERYTKSRPFEERRRGPSPLTAFREVTKGKRPAGKRSPQQGSGLSENRISTRGNIHAAV